MTLVKINAGMTGTQASDALFNNDQENAAGVQRVSNLMGKIDNKLYTGVRPFRAYSADATYVTTDAALTQTNGATSDKFVRTAGTSLKHYFDTGITYDPLTALYIDITAGSNPVSGDRLGVGFNTAGVFTGWVLGGTTTTSIIRWNPWAVSVQVPTLPPYVAGDIITVKVEATGVSFYINGTFIAKASVAVTSCVIQLCLAGNNVTATYSKPYTYESAFAPASLTTKVDALNVNYPFKKDATFINDSASSMGTVLTWQKNFIKAIKFFGLPMTDRISLFVVRRNSATNANKWQLQFYRDTGTGNGASGARELVISWDAPAYVEPAAGQVAIIEYMVGSVGFKAYVDWSQIAVGDYGSMTYNAVGYAPDAFVNFNTGGVVPVPAGAARISWPYRTADAPVTGTDMYALFTVLPDKDADGDTVGCTGASYNTRRNQYVISYYSFAKAAKLWLFDRRDLMAYASSGTLQPVPTRVIDVSAHIFHIQGNAYDAETDSYWILGSLNAVSSDTQRVLIRVDDEGNLLEKYPLSAFSFQAGMLALSPDGKNLIIKPNNRSWMLEIDKRTKTQIRQVTGLNINEGLAVDAKNSVVWIAGDDGVLKKHDYSSMAVLATYTFATLSDGSGTNVEGIIVDPADGALCFVADAYLHGSHTNGNAMWVFDFEKTIQKRVNFPEMLGLYTYGSPVIDFGAVNNLAAASILSGAGTIQYRGSNTAPTELAVNRSNWRDRPFYSDWGSTVPSAWSSTFTAFRYMQIRLV